jgi:hypothetical protein
MTGNCHCMLTTKTYNVVNATSECRKDGQRSRNKRWLGIFGGSEDVFGPIKADVTY